jgi:hypothetical protein
MNKCRQALPCICHVLLAELGVSLGTGQHEAHLLGLQVAQEVGGVPSPHLAAAPTAQGTTIVATGQDTGP